MSRIYTTVQGDMWDMIAYSYFSFPAGVMLTIPDVVERRASTLPPWKQVQR